MLCGAICALLLVPASASAKTSSANLRPADQTLISQIVRYRTVTWRWQRLMGERLIPGSSSYRTDPSRRYRRWVRNLWRRRAAHAQHRAASPPNYGAWLCIHHYEAAWNDAGAPYYGGLQMDYSFQLHYGRDLLRRKGTADNWTPLEQIWVAERARRSGLGFWPWPNTARACGVL